MPEPMIVIIGFIVSLVVSTIIIYIITKLFGEHGGIGKAATAAVVGSVIYALSYLFFSGLVSSIAGGIVWLIALQSLYRIGWGKSLIIAAIIWLVAGAVGSFLPTLTGPL